MPNHRVSRSVTMAECPECGSENTRVYEASDGVFVLDCGDCFSTNTSLYGDIKVVD